MYFKYSQPGCYFLCPSLPIRRLTFQRLPSTTRVVAVVNVKLSCEVVESTDLPWETVPLVSFVLPCFLFLFFQNTFYTLKLKKEGKKDTHVQPCIRKNTSLNPSGPQQEKKKKKKAQVICTESHFGVPHMHIAVSHAKLPKPPKVCCCVISLSFNKLSVNIEVFIFFKLFYCPGVERGPKKKNGSQFLLSSDRLKPRRASLLPRCPAAWRPLNAPEVMDGPPTLSLGGQKIKNSRKFVLNNNKKSKKAAMHTKTRLHS